MALVQVNIYFICSCFFSFWGVYREDSNADTKQRHRGSINNNAKDTHTNTKTNQSRSTGWKRSTETHATEVGGSWTLVLPSANKTKPKIRRT